MNIYSNLGGDSNVKSYEINSNSIRVMFNDFSIYEYTSSSVGIINLERMKLLADRGSGLNSFINTTVKKNYSRRIR